MTVRPALVIAQAHMCRPTACAVRSCVLLDPGQLAGRVQVSKAKEREAVIKEKDAYIRKLESRLLTQHRAPAASKAKSSSENSKAAPGA